MIYNDLMCVFMKSDNTYYTFKCCSKEPAAVVVLNLRRWKTDFSEKDWVLRRM